MSHSDSKKNRKEEFLGLQESEMPRSPNLQKQSSEQMIHVPTEFEGQDSDIIWLDDSSICCKQLKHYPAFIRDGTIIAVHSFALILAEDGSHNIGYLEDLYEDYRRQKMVKVRWFHRSEESSGVTPVPLPHEVIITPHVQVVNAECIDGLATVLTPEHYEQCLAIVSEDFSYGIYMCSRQIIKNKVKPFPLCKLCGYSNQTIFSALDHPIGPNKLKQQVSFGEEKEDGIALQGTEEAQSSREVVTNLVSDNQVEKTQPIELELKIRLSSKGLVCSKLDESEPHRHVPSFSVGKEIELLSHDRGKLDGLESHDEVLSFGVGKEIKLLSHDNGKFDRSDSHHEVPSFSVGDEIELLSHDSGMRGCWFRCKILQVSKKGLKVRYIDVEDVEGPGNLEEWVIAYRVAAPDKLGLRCVRRHTIRPCPTENSSIASFSIGAPVDAWRGDGWWEGLVVGSDVHGKDDVHVYFPGENIFKNFERKNLRISKDWIDNRWVEIMPKHDILSFISSNVKSNMKVKRCSTLGVSSGSGRGSSSMDNKVPTSSETEVVEKEGQELPVLAPINVVKK